MKDIFITSEQRLAEWRDIFCYGFYPENSINYHFIYHSFRILHVFANDLDDNFFFFGLSKYIRSKYISFFYVNQKLPGRKRFLTIDVILFICIESKVLVANNCRLLNFRLIIYEFFINDTNNNYHGITISGNRCLWLLAAYNRAIIYYKP